jgi:hypothetical protein
MSLESEAAVSLSVTVSTPAKARSTNATNGIIWVEAYVTA